MKSIYNKDNLACNSTGNDLSFEAKTWFESIIEKYPDYNPREFVELFSLQFGLLASKRIIELRAKEQRKMKTPNKVGTLVRWYSSKRTGRIIATNLRQGSDVVVVEWDDDFTVAAQNIDDLRVKE